MKWIHKFDNGLARIERVLIIIILTVMILIAFLQIILRNFFSSSISWGDILLRHLVLWIGFFGASLAAREGKHINIDVLNRLIPKRIRRITDMLVNLAAAAICFLLTHASIQFIGFEMDGGGVLFSDIPVWVAEVVIAFGFGLMSFRFFLHALDLLFKYNPTGEVAS
ncbi:TRAP transporter small permease [candidate division KSB1 bacterium]|nr:TRAP transporter small permease [candidate division KSB1 bacterium]